MHDQGWDPHREASPPPCGEQPASCPPFPGGSGYGPQPPPWAGGPLQGYGQPAVTPKSPAAMLVASWFVSGLGSILNGDTERGILILACHWGAWILAVICFVTIILIPLGLMFCAAAVGVWIWGVIDAYQGAQRYNVTHGYPPQGAAW